jgi:hypothetical protein
MRIDLKLDGIEPVRAALSKLTGSQARDVFAAALNDTAFRVRREMQKEMRTVFDRPTPYILKSVYVRQATRQRQDVAIEPTYFGGKGVDPQKILQAQEFGGRRTDKRSEVALRRVGILPAGYQTVIPSSPYPGSDDGRGNLRGSFLAQLLSYFRAFGEQGYRANMTDKRRARVHTGTKKVDGRRYFVAYGRLRSGPTAHLAPGIWAAAGTHGSDVRPVLLFVQVGEYVPLLSMATVAEHADIDEYMPRRLRYRIRQAVGE